jgi:membrane protein YdbS with pleckstrin-like domain
MGWRWMFGAELVPAGLFFVLMFFVPESTRWLVKNWTKKESLLLIREGLIERQQ